MDAYLTAYAIQLMRADWERINRIPAVPTVMPFGKHKGKPFSRIPRGYLRWMLDNCTLSAQLIEAVKEALY